MPSGQPPRRWRRSCAGVGRGLAVDLDARTGPIADTSRRTARPRRVLRTLAHGQSLDRGLQAALEEAIAQLPIPKVMSYPTADGDDDVQFVRPAHGLRRTARRPTWSPVTALGLEAGRVTHGHRFQGRDDIALAAPTTTRKRSAEGQVIAAFDERRARSSRRRSSRTRREGATRSPGRIGAARRSDRAGRMARGLRRRVRAGVPRRAAGMPDPDDAAEPEVLPACSTPTASCRTSSSSSPTCGAPTRSTSSRATSAWCAAARRRALLLRQDRQDERSRRACPKLATVVYHNKLGSQLERVERGSRGSLAKSPRRDRRGPRPVRPRGAAGQGRSRDRHGRRVPRTAGHDGTLLRAARRRAGSGRGGDRAALLAALRRRRAAGGAGRAGGRARRQAGDARRHVRHRRAAHRREGPVRPAPPCDRRDPHPRREEAGRDPPRTRRRRVRRLRRHAGRQGRARRSRELHLRSPARIPARRRLFGEPDRGGALSTSRRGLDLVPRAGRGGEGLRRAAGSGSPRRGEQAHRQHPAQVRRRGGGRRRSRPARGRRRARPLLALQKLQPIVDDRCAAGDFAGALLALASAKPAVDRVLRRRAGHGRRSGHPRATGWRCCAAWRRR